MVIKLRMGFLVTKKDIKNINDYRKLPNLSSHSPKIKEQYITNEKVHTLREIAKIFKKSPERIRQIERIALIRIRTQICKQRKKDEINFR